MTKLFHGTTSTNMEKIWQEGLNEPFLTNDPELAYYYALDASESIGGSPVVLEVYSLDEDLLRYDGASMDEPVDINDEGLEDARDKAWDKAYEEHPEWRGGEDIVVIPQTEWRISLEAVRAVWYEGVVKSFREL